MKGGGACVALLTVTGAVGGVAVPRNLRSNRADEASAQVTITLKAMG